LLIIKEVFSRLEPRLHLNKICAAVFLLCCECEAQNLKLGLTFPNLAASSSETTDTSKRTTKVTELGLLVGYQIKLNKTTLNSFCLQYAKGTLAQNVYFQPAQHISILSKEIEGYKVCGIVNEVAVRKDFGFVSIDGIIGVRANIIKFTTVGSDKTETTLGVLKQTTITRQELPISLTIGPSFGIEVRKAISTNSFLGFNLHIGAMHTFTLGSTRTYSSTTIDHVSGQQTIIMEKDNNISAINFPQRVASSLFIGKSFFRKTKIHSENK
jgi:hypothetical protein